MTSAGTGVARRLVLAAAARARLQEYSKSGYYGVIKNKGMWQGMGYDSIKQSRRSLTGLFKQP